MEVRHIFTHPKFDKNYKKLSLKAQNKAQAREKVFRNNPFNPTLKTHKLNSQEKEAWAFWIDFRYRIKFVFLSDEEVLFLDIGTHDIYK